MFTNFKKPLIGIVISVFIATLLIPNLLAFTPSGRQLVASDFLRSEGGYLKNQNNEIVCLRGMNAGGWLIQESWMCPINGADRQWANLDTLNTLKSRGFTDAQIQTLFTTYQNNWFSTYDLDNLRDMGVNCLRVPFWYRNFMLDEAGTWITGADYNNNPGFQKLDWVINECGKRGIYVILDCHGAPGGQSMDHSCGTLARNDLYDSPALRAVFDDLWTKIAQRYNGNPVVAAYDIMNEPQNNNGYTGTHSYPPGSTDALSRTYSVYDEVYKAIRQVDTSHVITMEAIWTGTCLPDPATYGWTNVMYQMHLYDTTTSMLDTRVGELKSFQSQYGVAVYTGEFNCDPYEEYAMQKLNEAYISWTTWAYKGSKQSIGNNWFLFVKNLPYADSTVDDYNTILSKWGTALNTSNFDTNANTVKKWILDRIEDPIAGQLPTPTPTTSGLSSLWYQNFEAGIGFSAGTKASVSLSSGNANSGASCVKLTLNTSGDPGTATKCVKVTPQNGVSIDVSGKNYLIFFVNDTQGANTVRITITDTNNATWSGWTATQSAQNQWTKIKVPLSSVSGINKAAVKQINLGEWNAGIYYFDDIYFAVNATDGFPTSTPAQSSTPSATPAQSPTPTLTLTATPTPTASGSVAWYQNFEAGTGFSAGTRATVSLSTGNANSGTNCVKMTLSSSGDPGTSSRCVKVTPQSGISFDATDKNYLNFYVNDTQGANTIRVTIIDTSNASWNGWTTAQSIQNQWTKISVPLSTVSGINKAAIKQINIGEWNAGTYYFDDINFTIN